MQGWEIVNRNTQRMPVPGGWLVRSYMVREESTLLPAKISGSKPTKVVYNENPTNVAVCFVPDEDHAWEIPPSPNRQAGQN